MSVDIMKTRIASLILLIAVVPGVPGRAWGEDWSHRFGVGVIAGEAWPVGDNPVHDKGGSNPSTGFLIRYGLDSRWGVGLSYDYVEVSRGRRYRSHLVTTSGIYSWLPEQHLRPFVEVGVGVAQSLSLKSSAGLEYFWTSSFSTRLQGSFYYLPEVGGPPTRETAFVASPGLMVSYFFGQPALHHVPPSVVQTPPPAPVEKPAPPPQVVQAPPPLPVLKPVPPAEKVSIELKVLFDTAKSDIKPEFRDEIKRIADFMTTYPETKAVIEGHTDSRASFEYNMGLSQRRADAVRQYLIHEFGISSNRLTAVGYGPSRPVATNATPEGRAMNRRVVAVLIATR